MKKLKPKQYAQALYDEIITANPDKIDSKITGLVLALQKRKQLNMVHEVIAAFEKYAKQQQGILDIEITTATRLSEEQRQKIQNLITKNQDITGVNITERISKKLIGGIIIQIGDTVIDNSLQTRLTTLKESFQ